MTKDLMEELKKEYEGIQRIEKEEGTLVIYADDDTLWKILEEHRDEFNMEFEAGVGVEHFIRVII